MQIIRGCGIILFSLNLKAVTSKVTAAIGYCLRELTECIVPAVRSLTCINLGGRIFTLLLRV